MMGWMENILFNPYIEGKNFSNKLLENYKNYLTK